MKNNIIKSICFTLILFVCLIILSHIFLPKDNVTEYRTLFKDANGILAEPDETIDVLIVGNSEAASSIIPMEIWNQYGYTSYACASPDQTLPQTISFIKRVCKKQKPKIIILETNSAFRTTDVSDMTDEIINNSLTIFQYHNRWKFLSEKDFASEPKYTNKNYLKGYNFSNDAERVEQSVKDDEKQIIPRSNKFYLRYIKDYCNKNGIKLIMISTPIKKFWSNANHVALQEFFDQNEIEFLDFNMYENEIGIDWEKDTRDGGDHLNYHGALKATKFLGEHLNKTKILTNHKEDEKYKFWNDEYEKYKEIIKNNMNY